MSHPDQPTSGSRWEPAPQPALQPGPQPGPAADEQRATAEFPAASTAVPPGTTGDGAASGTATDEGDPA